MGGRPVRELVETESTLAFLNRPNLQMHCEDVASGISRDCEDYIRRQVMMAGETMLSNCRATIAINYL